MATDDQLTATGQVLGTAAYISPEQAVGEPATAASDRYALAVVAFELLTGAKPFQAEHFAAQARAHVEDPPPLATERDPSLPASVDAVLERGLAKDPRERWESAREMVAALDRAMGSSRPATEPTRPIAAPPAPTSGRGSGWPLLAGLAALVLVAVVGFVLLSGGDGGRSTAANTPPTQATPRDKTTPRRRRRPSARRSRPRRNRHAGAHRDRRRRAAGPDLDRASQLQVEGFNARRAGDYEKALALNQQALEACGDTVRLNPCGFALFEIGAALNALGRPDEAIAPLEQRLELYGDNSAGEVKDELKKARKGWKGQRLSSPGWRPRWPASRSCRPSRGAWCTTTSAPPGRARCSSSAPPTASARPTSPPGSRTARG